MQYVRSAVGFFADMNPATLSGAIDIIVIKHDDGTFHSTPFHVRFGKMRLWHSRENEVRVFVNDRQVNLWMKSGLAGEAFFEEGYVGTRADESAAAAAPPVSTVEAAVEAAEEVAATAAEAVLAGAGGAAVAVAKAGEAAVEGAAGAVANLAGSAASPGGSDVGSPPGPSGAAPAANVAANRAEMRAAGEEPPADRMARNLANHPFSRNSSAADVVRAPADLGPGKPTSVDLPEGGAMDVPRGDRTPPSARASPNSASFAAALALQPPSPSGRKRPRHKGKRSTSRQIKAEEIARWREEAAAAGLGLRESSSDKPSRSTSGSALHQHQDKEKEGSTSAGSVSGTADSSVAGRAGSSRGGRWDAKGKHEADPVPTGQWAASEAPPVRVDTRDDDSEEEYGDAGMFLMEEDQQRQQQQPQQQQQRPEGGERSARERVRRNSMDALCGYREHDSEEGSGDGGPMHSDGSLEDGYGRRWSWGWGVLPVRRTAADIEYEQLHTPSARLTAAEVGVMSTSAPEVAFDAIELAKRHAGLRDATSRDVFSDNGESESAWRDPEPDTPTSTAPPAAPRVDTSAAATKPAGRFSFLGGVFGRFWKKAASPTDEVLIKPEVESYLRDITTQGGDSQKVAQAILDAATKKNAAAADKNVDPAVIERAGVQLRQRAREIAEEYEVQQQEDSNVAGLNGSSPAALGSETRAAAPVPAATPTALASRLRALSDDGSEVRRPPGEEAGSQAFQWSPPEITAETTIEISSCQRLLREDMSVADVNRTFDEHALTYDEFCENATQLVSDDEIVFRINGELYPRSVGAAIVFSKVLYDKPLQAPGQVSEASSSAPAPVPAPKKGLFSNWFGGGGQKRPSVAAAAPPATPPAPAAKVPPAVRPQSPPAPPTDRYLRPTSDQLASLGLRYGRNTIRFAVTSRWQGTQELTASIYLWSTHAKLVISDIDGTITKSDVLGQLLPILGRQWSQSGVAGLFTNIVENGYHIVYLSSRAIGQATLTRNYINWVEQEGVSLPDGPILMSPDRLIASFTREVIRRKPEEFKIACLQDLGSCFPAGYYPFHAGFGNRITDAMSYAAASVPAGRIFIINPKGEIVVNCVRGFKSSYCKLNELLHEVFPITKADHARSDLVVTSENFNDWNYWKLDYSP